MENCYCRLSVVLSALMVLGAGGALAQSDPDFSGRYVAKLNMYKDSCLDASVPTKVTRDIIVTKVDDAYVGAEETETGPVAWSGSLLNKGKSLELAHAEEYEDPTRGTCVYAEHLFLKKIKQRRAKKVNLVYSENCTSENVQTWHCETAWRGKAPRSPLP